MKKPTHHQPLLVALPFLIFYSVLVCAACLSHRSSNGLEFFSAFGSKEYRSVEPIDNDPCFNQMRLSELSHLNDRVLNLQHQYARCQSGSAKDHIGDLRNKLQLAIRHYNMIADETHETAFAHSHLPRHISLNQ